MNIVLIHRLYNTCSSTDSIFLHAYFRLLFSVLAFLSYSCLTCILKKCKRDEPDAALEKAPWTSVGVRCEHA